MERIQTLGLQSVLFLCVWEYVAGVAGYLCVGRVKLSKPVGRNKRVRQQVIVRLAHLLEYLSPLAGRSEWAFFFFTIRITLGEQNRRTPVERGKRIDRGFTFVSTLVGRDQAEQPSAE